MNLSYFISKRISREQREGFSSTIHKIALASIAVGLASAIVAFLVMVGFQETVKQKIYGFSGHLVITKFTRNNSPEETPLNYHIDAYTSPKGFSNIDHIQEYAHKIGVIKTDDEALGVVVKGVGRSFDQQRFNTSIVEGKFIEFKDSSYANQVLLSKVIADKLNVTVGENIIVHFFQNPPRFRKLNVVGIYETSLSEYFDNKVIIADIGMIKRLNDWSDSLAGGLEVFVKDVQHIDETGQALTDSIPYDLTVQRTSDRYTQVFEWLHLLGRQVNILLIIILAVVCVNMISIVLILVMERTQMIGMLKALGANDRLIRSVFLYNGVNLIVKGLFFGNALGLGLCYLQYTFKIIKLNAHDYFMSEVPVSWDWGIVIMLNLLTFTVVTLVLLLPTMIVSRISPIKAIRFD